MRAFLVIVAVMAAIYGLMSGIQTAAPHAGFGSLDKQPNGEDYPYPPLRSVAKWEETCRGCGRRNGEDGIKDHYCHHCQHNFHFIP